MQNITKNITKTLNQLKTNYQPLKLFKRQGALETEIKIYEPYNELGLNLTDWESIVALINRNWNLDEVELNQVVVDAFNTSIRPRCINMLERLAQIESLPTIILSILTQSMVQYETIPFGDDFLTATNVYDYIYQMSMLPFFTPQNLSATSSYIIEANITVSTLNAKNGVNLIYWDNDVTLQGNRQCIPGLKHVWDHYDYPHIHLFTSYEHYSTLLINAVRRTWISTLQISAGVKSANFRVNYGYMLNINVPNFSIEEYESLAILNHGTVIDPPYDEMKIRKMSDDDIERIIKLTGKCLRYKPILSTVYMTAKQLQQEKLLGNNPIVERYTLTLPQTYLANLELMSDYDGKRLPTGDEFDVKVFINRIDVNRIQSRPDYRLRAQQTDHVLYGNVNVYPYLRTLLPKEYNNYLNYLRNAASRQYLTSNIVKSVSPDGVSITVTTLSELAVATVALNKSNKGVNLALPDSITPAILELTDDVYINDYDMSTNLLIELNDFKKALELPYTSLNIVIVNAEVMPTTFKSICHATNIPLEVYSSNGVIGLELDSIFSFGLISPNMIFAAITLDQYLSDTNSFELFFTTALRKGTYYSVEFLDFSADILSDLLNSLIESITLITGQEYAYITFAPPIINTMRVGIRVIFSLNELPTQVTTYNHVTSNMLRVYCREISPSEIVIEPIKSLTFESNVTPQIVPRMGTNLMVSCTSKHYNDALGYMSTICRYTKSISYSTQNTYYEITGTVDQSRIAILDRIQMFRSNESISPSQLLPREPMTQNSITSRLTYNELVTQTDRLLLYISRRNDGKLNNNLSDYGSASFLNVCLTDKHYTMYDIDNIEAELVPGVTLIQTYLQWGEPLPYTEGDVLIYNSIFMNANATDADLSVPIIAMLNGVKEARNIYFNLPLLTDALYELLLPLEIVTTVGTRRYLKLGKFPPVPCLTEIELDKVLAIFPEPINIVRRRIPTLLDYYFTSRMLQRDGNAQTYYNAIILHQCLPFFDISW